MSEPRANYAGLGFLAGLAAVAGGLFVYIAHTQAPRVRVQELYTYPIKSCAGIRLTESQLDEFGFKYDRKWLIVEPDTKKFRHQRVLPAMATIRTAIRGGDLVLSAPGMPDMVVKQKEEGEKEEVTEVYVFGIPLVGVREGEEVDAWLTKALGVPSMLCRRPLHGYERGLTPNSKLTMSDSQLAEVPDIVAYCDEHPLLICSTASLADLNARLRAGGKEEVPMSRFRCNIVVSEEAGLFSSALSLSAFYEHKWRTVTVGGVELHSTGQKTRCKMTTVDQESGYLQRMKGEEGEENKNYFEPVRTLRTYRLDAKSNSVIFGESFTHTNASIGSTIRVGDYVEVLATKTPPELTGSKEQSE